MKPPTNNIDQLNPEKTFINVCPANILAKRRTDKLTSLKLYDKSSIGTSSGIKKKGIPDGKKSSKK